MFPSIREEFHTELEEMGLSEARKLLAHGEFSPPFAQIAEDWVRFKTEEQEAVAKARAEEREE